MAKEAVFLGVFRARRAADCLTLPAADRRIAVAKLLPGSFANPFSAIDHPPGFVRCK